MKSMRRLTTAVALLALAGCGGGEGDQVKEALTQFASDSRTGNAQGVCDALTADSRRLFDVIARGVRGPDSDCVDVVEEQLGGGGGGLEASAVESIEAADVDVEGDKARVKADDDDTRLPLERVDGRWRIDIAELPLPGYGLRGTAACTEATLRTIRSPLPKPTRPGIARDADRDADSLASLASLLERMKPPKGAEDEQREVVAALRANSDAWRRAGRAIRGVGAPLDAYNKALAATEKRARAVEPALGDLQVACLGDARTLAPAAAFREDAHRICRATSRAIDRAPENATLLRRLGALGRETTRKLRRLEPPPSLERAYRGALDAFSAAYAAIAAAEGARNPERAQERFELLGLRSSIAFFRVGLPRCGEL